MADEPRIISIDSVADTITQAFRPSDIVSFNGATLKISHLAGECKWHQHAEQEELFLCWKGTAIVRMDGDREFPLQAGELVVVPAGTTHQSAGEDAYVLHIELPRGTIYPRAAGDAAR